MYFAEKQSESDESETLQSNHARMSTLLQEQ